MWTSRAQPVRPQVCGEDTRWNFASRKSSPRSRMGFGRSKIRKKLRFTFVFKTEKRKKWQRRRLPFWKPQRKENSWWTPERQCWTKRLELRWNGCFTEIQNPHNCGNGQWEVQTREEAQAYVHDLDLFVTVQILDDTPAVLSLGKLCDEHGYTYEWASGQRPRLTKHGKNKSCKTENFVPMVVPGLSSSSSTSPSQDS